MFNNGATVFNLTGLNTTEYAGASDAQRVVRYITNHDVNSSDGTPLELFGGAAGSMAAVTATYMKGVPMIYNGQEIGLAQLLSFIGTAIDWNGKCYDR